MIFITGSTGLVGSHLLLELIQKGQTIRALKRKSSSIEEVRKVFGYYLDKNKADELFNKIDWVEGNLLESDKIDNYLEGVNEIYHCAAMVSFNSADKKDMMAINVDGTADLVNLALKWKINKFCFVSSVAAVGPMTDGEPADETSFWKKTKNSSWYGISKFESEMEVWRAGAEGLNSVIVNPSVILGPGNWHRGAGRMFTTVEKGLPFYTSGLTGYVDVRDVVKIMVLLMDKEIYGKRFILNSDNLSFKEVFSLIAENLGKKPPYLKAGRVLTSVGWWADYIRSRLFGKPNLITKETAKASMNRKYYSNEKITEVLDYRFIPVATSIKDICEIYKNEK